MYGIWGTVADTVTWLHAGKPSKLGLIPGEYPLLSSTISSPALGPTQPLFDRYPEPILQR